MAVLLALGLAMQDGLDEWIKRLGHEDPAEREKAEKKIAERIAEVSKLAAALEKAGASKDAEVRGRAERLRKALAEALKGPDELRDLDEQIWKNPADASLWTKRAAARLRKGDATKAVEDASEALRLDPRLVAAWTVRAKARRTLGDIAGTLRDLDEALRLDPEQAVVYSERALARLAVGDLEGAAADVSRAIELDPKLPEAYANRGAIRKLKGQLEAAAADFERALEVAPADWPQRKHVEGELKKLRK